MDKYSIVKYPDPILRERCSEVTDFTGMEGLLEGMYAIASGFSTLAISSPQVRDSRRIVVAKIDGQIREFINPEIVDKEGESYSLEGCMSLKWYQVRFKKRSRKITVQYQDRYGVQHINTYKGIASKALQHEIDHLDGKLIID